MHWIRNLSIAKKLYFVVGIMAVLIAGELFTIRFAMNKLSAVRAFVGGEGVWSKAQKDAALSLQRFGATGDENDYRDFLSQLQIIAGDHLARLELQKPVPDIKVVTQGFIQGGIHPDDIPPIVNLLRNYSTNSYIRRALGAWIEGDELSNQMRIAGEDYHRALASHPPDRHSANEAASRIRTLNDKLTMLENEFSATLGEGSRWMEKVVFSLLFVAVLMVESVGLTLSLITVRRITRGLRFLNRAALKIGEGNLEESLHATSSDEIGTLTESLDQMRVLLQKSHAELENRVAERTRELHLAVQSRDEFLSIASHELKTPLTSLFLEMQIISKILKHPLTPEMTERVVHNIDLALRQGKRLGNLVDDLLDLTRIQAGRLELQREPCDLRALVEDSMTSLAGMAERRGSSLSFRATAPVLGYFDPPRITQVITNLVTNAIKYGGGKPIEVTLEESDNVARLSVKDHGIGIPHEKQNRIFERFERAVDGATISGLGLGLYIANQIVLAHGGSIQVHSEPGDGSSFTVSLPANSEQKHLSA